MKIRQFVGSGGWQRSLRIGWILGAALHVGGCGPSQEAKEPKYEQTLPESLHMMCDVDRLASLDPEEDPISIEASRYDWLFERVKHPDAIELLTLLRVEANATKAEMLRASLKKVESKRAAQCPLADYWEAEE